MKHKKKSQTILEYILIITAIITAVIMALPIFRGRVARMIYDAGDTIDNRSAQFRMKAGGVTTPGDILRYDYYKWGYDNDD